MNDVGENWAQVPKSRVNTANVVNLGVYTYKEKVEIESNTLVIRS